MLRVAPLLVKDKKSNKRYIIKATAKSAVSYGGEAHKIMLKTVKC
jgi:hypothetical protein